MFQPIGMFPSPTGTFFIVSPGNQVNMPMQHPGLPSNVSLYQQPMLVPVFQAPQFGMPMTPPFQNLMSHPNPPFLVSPATPPFAPLSPSSPVPISAELLVAAQQLLNQKRHEAGTDFHRKNPSNSSGDNTPAVNVAPIKLPRPKDPFAGPGVTFRGGRACADSLLVAHTESLEGKQREPGLTNVCSLQSAVSATEVVSPDADPLGLFAPPKRDDFVVESGMSPPVSESEKNISPTTSFGHVELRSASSTKVEPTTWYSLDGAYVPKPFIQEIPDGVVQEKSITSTSGFKLRLRFYHALYPKPAETRFCRLNRAPDIKLGGVCGDLTAFEVYCIIHDLTKVRIEAMEMFGKNLGRCNVWLFNPSDVVTMRNDLSRRVWMAPPCHGYAAIADDESSRDYLVAYLESLREHGPSKVRFPRHLMTADHWEP